MLLGFDIGGTKCSAVIGKKDENRDLVVIDKRMLPTDLPVYEMTDALFAAALQMLEDNNTSLSDLEGIGISCGGPLNSTRGIILSPPNLPGWDNIPIAAMAEQQFGCKALLQNDANACALAEWHYGIGVGYRNIVFLTFGTGMGAGLILNGRLYSGTSDTAGEIGHVRMEPAGPVGYGKAGSFEGFCSGGGIVQAAQFRARERFQMGTATGFCPHPDDLTRLTAKKIAEAAVAGDPDAIDIFRTCAQYLGRGIAILADILNPELVIIGGIYGRAQSLIEPYMYEVIAREALPHALQSCQVVPSLLGEHIGDYAALALADTAK
jgi:glucokinase